HPVNIQTACLIMEGAEFTENIINGVERPVKAAELFAFTLRVRAGNTDVLTDAGKRLPRCKMRLKKRLLAFSRRLHARIRKTRYMHKMRCLLINRRSLLLALRLLWKTPIFPSNSRFPRLCAKCLL